MAERAYVAIESLDRKTDRPIMSLVEASSVRVSSAQRQSSREVALLVFISAVLHAGVAFGVYGPNSRPPLQRVSKVDIEFTRPAIVAPPPLPTRIEPPPSRSEVQKVAQAQRVESIAVPTEEPLDSSLENEVQLDKGSSAEAASEGNLFAGKGGTSSLLPRPPAPPVRPPAPPAPVVRAHEGANYSKNPRPGYPARAVREGWQGEVLVRVQVQANGRAGILKVHRSSGHPLLDDAALTAIKSWSFVPAYQGERPVSGWVTVPIVFRLQ